MPKAASMPRLLLHLEGLAMAVAAVAFFASRGGDWLLFALLILAPDLSAAAYLAGPRVGSITYNTVHNYVLPGALATFALIYTNPLALNISLIWFAHIGADRALGFGLKYPTEFKDTHLNRV